MIFVVTALGDCQLLPCNHDRLATLHQCHPHPPCLHQNQHLSYRQDFVLASILLFCTTALASNIAIILRFVILMLEYKYVNVY